MSWLGMIILSWMITLLLLFLFPRVLGYVIETIFSLFGSKMIKSLRVGKVLFFPKLEISDFRIDVNSSRRNPQISIQWKHFQLNIKWHKLFRGLTKYHLPSPGKVERFVEFAFIDFHMDCIGLRFKDVLDPSSHSTTNITGKEPSLHTAEYFDMSEPKQELGYVYDRWGAVINGTMKLSHYLLQEFLLLFKFQFDSNFDFDISMTTHKSKIVGSCNSLSMYCLPCHECTTIDGIVGAMDIRSGALEIYQDGKEAVEYFGQLAQFRMDYNLPSKMQIVSMSLFGKDEAAVTLQPFLEFYKQYQTAEDDAIELKLARRLSTSGKMYNILMQLKHMKVSLRDNRSTSTCVMEIDDMLMKMETYSVTSLGYRYVRGLHRIVGIAFQSPEQTKDYTKLSSIRNSVRLSQSQGQNHLLLLTMEKVLSMKAKCVRWPAFDKPTNLTHPSSAFVKEANLYKTLKIINEGDFIDTENMNISVSECEFQRVSLQFLEWLIICQDTANNIPTSRFAHLKKSIMVGKNRSMIFSTTPSDHPTVSSVFEDSDELVVVSTKNTEAIRTTLPRNPDSIMEGKAEMVEIHSSLFAGGLASRYQVHMNSNLSSPQTSPTSSSSSSSSTNLPKNGSRVGVLWIMPGLNGKMTVSPTKASFHYMNMNTSMTIKFTVEKTKRQVTSHGDILSSSIPKMESASIPSSSISSSSLPFDASTQVSSATISTISSPSITKVNSIDSSTLSISSSNNTTNNNFTRSHTTDSGHRKRTSSHSHIHSHGNNNNNTTTNNIYRPNSRQSFIFSNEKSLNPYLSSDIVSIYMTTTKFEAKWTGIDTTTELGDVEVFTSMGSTIKFLCSFNMIREMVNRVLGHMNRIKALGSVTNKSITNTTNSTSTTTSSTATTNTATVNQNDPLHPPDPMNTAIMDKMIVHFCVGTLKDKTSDINRTNDGSNDKTKNNHSKDNKKSKTHTSHRTKKDVDQGNSTILFFDMIFEEIKITQSVRKQIYIWKSLDIIYNNWKDRSAMIQKDFYFESVQSYPMIENSYNPIRHQKVHMKEFQIGMSSINHFGETYEAFMTQYEIYKLATFKPIPNLPQNDISNNESTLSKEEMDWNLSDPNRILSSELYILEQNRLRPEPYVMDITFDLWIIHADGPYKGTYVKDLMEMRYDNFYMHVDASQKELDMYTDIANLDFGLEDENNNYTSSNAVTKTNQIIPFVMHSNATGGEIEIKVSMFTVRFGDLDIPTISMKDYIITGLLYSASIDDPRIQIYPIAIALVDTPNIISLSYPTDTTVYVTVKKSSAPNKMYFNIVCIATECILSNEVTTSEYIEAFGQSTRYYSGTNIDSSPPMLWWDSMRYWLHGIYSIRINKLQINHFLQQNDTENLKVITNISKYDMIVDNSSLEFCCVDIDIDLEVISLNSNHRSSLRPSLNGSEKSDEFKKSTRSRKSTDNDLLSMNKLIRLPGIIFSLIHSAVPITDASDTIMNNSMIYPLSSNSSGIAQPISESSSKSISSSSRRMSIRKELFIPTVRPTSHSHHDVYLYPCSYDHPNDKFALFRSKPMSSKWAVELLCIDNPQNPISIYARLDILSLIITAINNSTTSTTTTTTTTNGNKDDYTYNYDYDYENDNNRNEYENRKRNVSFESKKSGNSTPEYRSGSTSPVSNLINSTDSNSTKDMDLIKERKPTTIRGASPITLNSSSNCNSYSDGNQVYDSLDLYIAAKMIEQRLEIENTKPIPIPNQMSIGDMIHSLDLQVAINSLMINSWQSTSSLGGIVFSLQRMELQLRMLRDLKAKLIVSNSTKMKDSNNGNIVDADNNNESSLRVSIESNTIPSVEIYTLIVDHMFTEIHFIELHVRKWVILDKSLEVIPSPAEVRRQLLTSEDSTRSHSNVQFGLRRASAAGRDVISTFAQEPHSTDEIKSLMIPIYKLAHATRMEISLTEDGNVCAKSHNFRSIGVIEEYQIGANLSPSSTSESFHTVPNPISNRRAASLPMTGKYSRSIGKNSSDSNGNSNSNTMNLLDTQGILLGIDDSYGVFYSESSTGSVQFVLGKDRRRHSISAIQGKSDYNNNNNNSNTSNDNSNYRQSNASDLYRKSRYIARLSGNSPQLSPIQLTPSRIHRGKNSIDIKLSSNLSSNVDNSNKSKKSGKSGKRSSKKYSENTIGEFRPRLTSFVANHAALTPPRHALPLSYEGSRPIHTSQLTSQLLSNKPIITATKIPQEFSMYCSSIEADPNSYGNKIWGLRIIDMRLLWTLEIRDILFAYVSQYFIVLEPLSASESIGEGDDEQDNNYEQYMVPERGRQRSATTGNVINVNNTNSQLDAKATLTDFKSIEKEDNFSPKTSDLRSHTPRAGSLSNKRRVAKSGARSKVNLMHNRNMHNHSNSNNHSKNSSNNNAITTTTTTTTTNSNSSIYRNISSSSLLSERYSPSIPKDPELQKYVSDQSSNKVVSFVESIHSKELTQNLSAVHNSNSVNPMKSISPLMSSVTMLSLQPPNELSTPSASPVPYTSVPTTNSIRSISSISSANSLSPASLSSITITPTTIGTSLIRTTSSPLPIITTVATTTTNNNNNNSSSSMLTPPPLPPPSSLRSISSPTSSIPTPLSDPLREKKMKRGLSVSSKRGSLFNRSIDGVSGDSPASSLYSSSVNNNKNNTNDSAMNNVTSNISSKSIQNSSMFIDTASPEGVQSSLLESMRKERNRKTSTPTPRTQSKSRRLSLPSPSKRSSSSESPSKGIRTPNSPNTSGSNSPNSHNRRHSNPDSLTSSISSTLRSPIKRTKITNSRSFMVELIDPQINFLDVTSHSSVIIVAGRSFLEGYRGNSALLPTDKQDQTYINYNYNGDDNSKGNSSPNRPNSNGNNIPMDEVNLITSITPKRKSELKLKMDGVSAFTVPTSPVYSNYNSTSPSNITNSSNPMDTDIVHWKVMDNTITEVPIPSQGIGITSPIAKIKRRNSLRIRSMNSNSGNNSGSNTSTNHYHPITSGESSPYLRVAIKDFKIRAQYTFWIDVLATEAHNMTVYLSKDELLCTFLLDLPEIIVDTDSSQFYVIINVLRNLLLVPPPPLPQRIRTSEKTSNKSQDPSDKSDNSNHDSKRDPHRDSNKDANKLLELAKDEKLLERHGLKLGSAPLDINSRATREILKVLIEESMNRIGINGTELSMARIVQVFIGKGVWLLRSHTTTTSSTSTAAAILSTVTANTSSNTSNINILTGVVETGFTGVYATFTYHEDRSSSILFETQRFWAKNSTVSVHNNNSSSTSSSSSSSSSSNNNSNNFSSNQNISETLSTNNTSTATDSTTSYHENSNTFPGTITNSNSNSGNSSNNNNTGNSSWVIMPVLLETEPCERCGAMFTTESNQANSCVFHADEDGSPGEYRDVMIIDELTNVPTYVSMWTCCGRTQRDAPGCSSRPHVCKEVMISIRAEANPTIKVDNIDIQVIHTLEISFFPGALYDLRVQISRGLADMLHNYFSIEPSDMAIIEKDMSVGLTDKENKDMDVDESGHSRNNNQHKNSHDRGNDQDKQDTENTISTDTAEKSQGKKSLVERLGIGSILGHKNIMKSKDKDKGKEDESNSNNQNDDSITPATVSSTDKEKDNVKEETDRSTFSGILGRKYTLSNITGNSSAHNSSSNITNRPSSMSISGPVSFGMLGNSNNSSSNSSNNNAVVATTPVVRQEGLYINYMRVGDINVDVSTSGFPLNIENYRAVVEPFICRGEVLNWHKLIMNIERHAMYSVTKNFASNIGNRIGNILLSAVNRGTGVIQGVSQPSKTGGVPRSLSMAMTASSSSAAALESTEESIEVTNAKRLLLLGSDRKSTGFKKGITSLLGGKSRSSITASSASASSTSAASTSTVVSNPDTVNNHYNTPKKT